MLSLLLLSVFSSGLPIANSSLASWMTVTGHLLAVLTSISAVWLRLCLQSRWVWRCREADNSHGSSTSWLSSPLFHLCSPVFQCLGGFLAQTPNMIKWIINRKFLFKHVVCGDKLGYQTWGWNVSTCSACSTSVVASPASLFVLSDICSISLIPNVRFASENPTSSSYNKLLNS